MVDANRVYIFDTTLRDGEQSPGVSLNLQEKLEIAQQLARMGVDIIEAGFPITSEGDFEAVKAISQQVKGPTIAGLARIAFQDIDRAWEAVQYAEKPRIHVFCATSEVHMKYKLRMTQEEVLEGVIKGVSHAKKYTDDVEFSPEDGFRSDIDFMCQVVEAAIEAGATTINIPDTVGYATPEGYGRMFKMVQEKVPESKNVILSCHCHNDLGMATANSLAAVENGVRQVEGAINGIGERAGNTALEEIAMAIYTRKDHYGLETNINTREIYRTSKLVSSLTGMPIQYNKAVVGRNAFLHEAGIHQHGVIEERTTYEIMNPELIGLVQNNIYLGKHSGRHAFTQRLEELGFELNKDELDKAFFRFKALADRKKEITDKDIEAIVEDEIRLIPEKFHLETIQVSSGSKVVPTATVSIKLDGELVEEAACGEGPVDAVFNSIDKVTGIKVTLKNYVIDAVTAGRDAMGDVTVKVECQNKVFTGKGLSTDIIEASAKAYINAINKLVYEIGMDEARDKVPGEAEAH